MLCRRCYAKTKKKCKKILITGSEGLIGSELVELLNKDHQVIRADLKVGMDLRDFETCLELCNGVDEVYHLMGVKGSPQMTQTKPVDFMAPMLQCDTNMIVAAQICKVKKFLYTSSIALLNLDTDFFPGTAKQTAETLIDAMKVQYPKGTKYCVVRPASVYGRYENFDRDNLMFISKMIKQTVIEGKDIELWNDGESLRDVIHARDVARAMIKVLNKKYTPKTWLPIGSGYGEKLVDIAKIIAKHAKVKLKIGPKGKTDSRTMELKWNFKPKVNLEEGIKETIEYVRNNYNCDTN